MAIEKGRILLRAGIRGVVASLVPGGGFLNAFVEEIAVPFCESAWNSLRHRSPAECQDALNGLATVPVEEARRIATEELETVRLDPVEREQLTAYLSVVPMTAARAISRTNDGGRPSVLPSQLPGSRDSLLSLLPSRPPKFEPGAAVPGRDFRLVRLLGQGGFGEVWEAHNVRRTALAPQAFKFCLDPELQKSLEREVELLDRIEREGTHEGIVRLLDTALTADPPFVVYEYVDGGDLLAWLRSFDGRPPPQREVERVVRQTAEALAFAHDRRVVHRDLKPSNLLVTRTGRVKVADFGIGTVTAEKSAREAARSTGIDATFTALRGACTPMYADRAQRQGRAVDARADVYALGVIAYQLLMGDVTLSLPAYWREDLLERGVGPVLLGALDGCLAAPARRLPDGRALLAALGSPGDVRAPGPPRAEPPETEPLPHLASPSPAPPPRSRRPKTVPPPSSSAVPLFPRAFLETIRPADLHIDLYLRSAHVIAHLAKECRTDRATAAAVVDGFWDYVADVKSHYTHSADRDHVNPGTLDVIRGADVRQPKSVLVIPHFGTFRVRHRGSVPSPLEFRSRTPAERAGRKRARSRGGLLGKLRPQTVASSAGSGVAGTWLQQPVRQPGHLSVKRRIAWWIGLGAGLDLGLVAGLLDEFFATLLRVFDRPALGGFRPVLSWPKRGVMRIAPGGERYWFRCRKEFARRLILP